LNAPDIQFTTPDLTRDTLSAASEFTARVAWVLPKYRAPDVRLVLTTGGGLAREFPMQKRDGTYVVAAPRSSSATIRASRLRPGSRRAPSRAASTTSPSKSAQLGQNEQTSAG